MTISQIDLQLTTILPDGTGLKTYSSGSGWGIDHRMGEKKRISGSYSSDVSLEGCIFYVNIATFMVFNQPNPISGKGQYYYTFQMPADITTVPPGTALQLTLATSLTFVDLAPLDNYKVWVIPDGANSFEIVIEYYMMADLNGYMGPQTNHEKFLKDAFSNPNEIASDISNKSTFAVPGNIYSEENRCTRFYVFIENPAVPFPGESFAFEEKMPGMRAGWYFYNDQNTPPWFTNTFFKVVRNGNEVFNLSNSQPNYVEIYANTDNNTAYPVTHFVAGVIRSDQFDDSIDFMQNYQGEFQWIKTANGNLNIVSAPMTDPTYLGSSQWNASFHVTSLPLNAKVRFIGIVYSMQLGGMQCNSFISPEYLVNAMPNYEGGGFDVKSSLDDYNREFLGNDLECCIEERMRSKIKLEFPFNQWADHILARLGVVTSNDIRRYLSQVNVEIYDEYNDVLLGGLVHNTYDMQVAGKTGPTSYQTPNGMTLNFSSAWAELTYEWRNRFEANIPNIQTLINGSPAFGPQTNQYWGGKTLKIKWTLTFFYNDIFPQFTDEIIFIQQMRVKDYGEMAVKHYDEQDLEYTNLSNICNDETVCFAGILQNPSLEGYKLITNIVPAGAAYVNLEEAEIWIGNELPQLLTNKIVDQDEDYAQLIDETAAKFCVDGSKLSVNSQYQISALAKKYVDTGFRITEIANPRITESDNKRITE